MILFRVDQGHMYSMAPGDSLYFDGAVLPSGDDGWILNLVRRDGKRSWLIMLDNDNRDEFELRLIACLQAGRQDHTLLVDLEGLRTLAKRKG